MPSAASGVLARGRLRRTIRENLRLPAQDSGRLMEAISGYRQSIRFRPGKSKFPKSIYFTLQLSGFGVECGRLGEVESLVGDCRPPPPGNPRQPTTLANHNHTSGKLAKNPTKIPGGFFTFIPIWQKNGGDFLPMCKYLSLNNSKYLHNLKKLKISQYFKNSYSFSSCIELFSVLEFASSYYHLYGDWLEEPPSIVITNVLGK